MFIKRFRSLQVLLFVAEARRRGRREIGSKGSMETLLLSALKQKHCFPMAEANGFPYLPAVQCSELRLGSDQTQFAMEPWHLGKPW